MKYIFPAVFTPAEEGGYLVNFPDITDHTSYACMTEGDTLEEALDMASDVLNLTLWSMEEDGAPVPRASAMQEMKAPEGGFVNLISANTKAYREKYDTRAVRKNVTIPHWLDVLGTKNKVNFSKVLQDALMRELHVHRA